jgi:hypothetical protein
MVSVNIQEQACVLFPPWQGHMAAAERLLYEIAHRSQGFVPREYN